MWRRTTAGASLAVIVALAGCAGGQSSSPGAAGAPATGPTASATVAPPSPTRTQPAPRKHRPSPTHSPTPVRTTAPPVAAAAPFRWDSAAVTAASLGKSWHAGCPVGPTALRALSMTFWGFDRKAHHGTLIVNATYLSSYVAAFRAIYAARFPIRQMQPVSAYGGNDNKSMAADNTSAFNCRYAVSNGPKHWSMHAYGQAVDIDPLENPYQLDGKVLPPAGEPYTDRSNVRPGMIVTGSAPVGAFAAVRWGWGGSWSSSPDYQHFSSNGG